METFDSSLDTSDIVNWDVVTLHRTARVLKNEVELNPIPRQAQSADRLLGHCAFEMWARRHRDTPEEAILGTETTTRDNQVA